MSNSVKAGIQRSVISIQLTEFDKVYPPLSERGLAARSLQGPALSATGNLRQINFLGLSDRSERRRGVNDDSLMRNPILQLRPYETPPA